MAGGGTLTSVNTQPTLEAYENIFGPAGRDVKIDSQRHKRHQRWHLPDALKGHNQYLTDRVDGLITDATNSPFTRNILPYVYLENPDQKLKWNVYSFDEGIASRVPYEAAARVLPQSKRSFAGYTVRQGLAIAMEHNFMMSAAGQQNFKNQLTQLVGSIQLTNDLDVHVALLQAPSHQKYMNERYHDQHKTTAQICREYVDMFGILQKVPNALDHIIEDAKNTLKTWGSSAPTFMLCNGALTTQLTMNPEVTNYLTNGPDGKARLAKGPDLPSYRGLSIINTRKFSMDSGTAPRDLLRRRVRVAEYYHIPWNSRAEEREYEFYDQSRDTMFRLSWSQLMEMANMAGEDEPMEGPDRQNHTWSQTPGGKRVIPWTPGGGLPFLQDGGVLAGSEFNPVWYPRDDPLVDARMSRKPDGGLLFPAPVHGSSNTPKIIRETDLVQRVNASVSAVSWRPPEADFADYDNETETFGGGIFREVLHGTGVTDKAISNFPNLELPGHKVDADRFPVADIARVAAVILTQQINATDLINSLKHVCTSSDFETDATHVSSGQIFQKMAYVIRMSSGPDPAGVDIDVAVRTWKTLSDQQRKQAMQAVPVFEAYFLDPTVSAECNGALGGLPQPFVDELKQMVNYAAVPTTYRVMRGGAVNVTRNLGLAVGNAVPVAIYREYPGTAGGYAGMALIVDGVRQTLVQYAQTMYAWSQNAICDAFTEACCTMQSSDKIRKASEEMDMWHKNILTASLVGKFEAEFAGDATAQQTHLNNINQDGAAIRAILDTKCNTTGATEVDNMAANVHYSLRKLQVPGQLLSAPNLHLNTCGPLFEGDEMNSASSLNPDAWMVQQLAGMMPLDTEMCKILSSKAAGPAFSVNDVQVRGLPLDVPKEMYGDKEAPFDVIQYMHFLKNPRADGYSLHQPNKNFLTFLMKWFMSYFHPSKSVRARAHSTLAITTHGKAELCSAIAHCIDTNVSTCDRLEKALKRIVNPATFRPDADGSSRSFVTSAASEEMLIIPATITEIKQTRMNTRYSWDRVPVNDRDGFRGVNYLAPGKSQEMHLKEGTQTLHDQVDPFCNGCTEGMYTAMFANVRAPNANDRVYDIEKAGEIIPTDNGIPIAMLRPWLTSAPKGLGVQTMLISPEDSGREHHMRPKELYDSHSADLQAKARAAAQSCSSRDVANMDNVLKHFVLVLCARFWEDTSRFMGNGKGVAIDLGGDRVVRNGKHFMHGPSVPEPLDELTGDAAGSKKDLVILRPNIEHEMLGIIMGRGGTQELGATFWGQTELSCYDDAQHGIWGMSYKYHERAMVTNERNLIRVFDVAFDGYNGGMDQEAVDWNSNESIQRFANSTYNKDRPYSGPSMLVMALPHNPAVTRCNWPNPVVFHHDMPNNPTPDPQKNDILPDVDKYMVFNHQRCPKQCTPAQEVAYQAYIRRLGMHQWASLDSSSRPAGDCCIANESTSNMLAFQGTMKVFDTSGGLVEHIQGSGHIGPSYVGVASIREGRGVQNTHAQPQMIRQI